ncbi:MAG: hypothetical protein ACLT98_10755 [Eggerthellaceae bacterium]
MPQQTAIYVKEAPDEVFTYALLRIDAVLDYDALSELYYGSRSDAVKATYTGDDEARRLFRRMADGRTPPGFMPMRF